MNSKFRETMKIAQDAIAQEMATVRNVRSYAVHEGERSYMVTENLTDPPKNRPDSFPPPRSSIPPSRGSAHRLVGKRRAIRYLMMFSCSLLGGFFGTLLCHLYLK